MGPPNILGLLDPESFLRLLGFSESFGYSGAFES